MQCIAHSPNRAMHCTALFGLWATHCIAHTSYGLCTALPIRAMNYALHWPYQLWAMHCIAHTSYGLCTALPCSDYGLCTALPIRAMGYALHCSVRTMGYALHCPYELWAWHCIAHTSYGLCTALPCLD